MPIPSREQVLKDLSPPALLAEAMKALDPSNGPEPPPEDSWLMYSRDDYAGGAGGVSRFPTKRDLLDACGRLMPVIEASETDLPELLGKTLAIRDQALGGTISMDDAQASLNELMAGASNIVWWGRFADVCDGDSSFAVEMRERFRETDEDGYDVGSENLGEAPLTADERRNFSDWLRNFGF